jgi:hypothetical protein
MTERSVDTFCMCATVVWAVMFTGRCLGIW